MWARRRALVDRLAAYAVTAGGVGIIGSILAILVFLVAEMVPLLYGARVEVKGSVPFAGVRAGSLMTDPYRTHVAGLGSDGVVRVLRLRDQRTVVEQSIVPDPAPDPELAVDRPARPLVAVSVGRSGEFVAGSTADGRVAFAAVDWRVRFVGQQRVVEPVVDAARVVTVDPQQKPLSVFALGTSPDGSGYTVVAERADGRLAMVRGLREENEFTGEVVESDERFETPSPVGLTQLVMDEEQRNLFGAVGAGSLLWWDIDSGLGAAGEPRVVSAGSSPVTALTMLLGGRSLVVGQADGSLSVWFVVSRAGTAPQLTRIRDFEPLDGAILRIVPSQRDKGFLAETAAGRVGLFYSTSHRRLWEGALPGAGAGGIALTPRADGVLLLSGDRLSIVDVRNRHPDVSLASLFMPVWYEGYDRPEQVWQSSGATDDFEPKYSLTPLLVGTLKGTFYSLLIAIPLGVLGAMYVSQFMHPRLKRVIKPTVEIMAALPSVVLGFLAGLWLAPRLERLFPALILMFAMFPVVIIAAGFVWESVPRRLRGVFPTGSEVVLFVGVLALGAWACVAASHSFEALAFGGSFQTWLMQTTGLPYDQRNAVVVGLAMGVAVIPIIFAVSEDAFSNVPRELVSGSLALGANRWQTVTRVVLPTASPGIFSAIMIGFGRAVGETMIVLMATGNTPIQDWNPFNGFRTLSANIAVEIPEAPQFGTLYRVLFLAALLLFVVTFAVNTAAELVRQRLRQRYGRL